MENKIHSFIGVGDISFGSKRDIIRSNIGSKFLEIKRNEFADNTSDYYEDLGFFVEYSKENLCEAIEFTNSSNPTFNCMELFSLTFSSLKERLDSLSSNYEIEEEIGVTYYDLGIGISCEYGSDKIESIIVFSKDYW